MRRPIGITNDKGVSLETVVRRRWKVIRNQFSSYCIKQVGIHYQIQNPAVRPLTNRFALTEGLRNARNVSLAECLLRWSVNFSYIKSAVIKLKIKEILTVWRPTIGLLSISRALSC